MKYKISIQFYARLENLSSLRLPSLDQKHEVSNFNFCIISQNTLSSSYNSKSLNFRDEVSMINPRLIQLIHSLQLSKFQLLSTSQPIEYGIFGEASHISTNQKRESTVFSVLIGRNMRPFPENTLLSYYLPIFSCPNLLLVWSCLLQPKRCLPTLQNSPSKE